MQNERKVKNVYVGENQIEKKTMFALFQKFVEFQYLFYIRLQKKI